MASPCPPGNLVEPSELARYSVPALFLAQFIPRAVELQISTGGALGAMAFTWRWKGEDNFSPTPISSSAITPWAYPLDVAFAYLTWATANYALSTIYTVDEAGTVTGGGGELTASRYDLRTTACSSVTSEALTLMQNAIKRPLLTWTDDARTHAAKWVYSILKGSKGSTANNAGEGDANIYADAALARAYFLFIGQHGRPDGWVDTSPTLDGPMLSAYPSSLPPRNW